MQQKVFHKYTNTQASIGDLALVFREVKQYTKKNTLYFLVSTFSSVPNSIAFDKEHRLATFQEYRLSVLSAKRLSESKLLGGVVVVYNVDANELSHKLESASVVIYLGENNGKIEKWLRSRESSSLDTGDVMSCANLSHIVTKALDWIHDTCNMTSNFTHPFDEDRLKVVANTLYEIGEPIDECAIFNHCKKNGWMEKSIYSCISTFRKAQNSRLKVEGRYTKESLFSIWKIKPEDMQRKSYLKTFLLENMWGYKIVEWNEINDDVNILVGINGVGKTTLLDAIYSHYSGIKDGGIAKIKESDPIAKLAYPMSYVRTADIPIQSKSIKESRLTQELNGVIMQNKAGSSFFNYFMRQLYETPDNVQIIKQNTDELFQIINEFFKDTGKKIDVDKTNNSYLSFRIEDREEVINHTQLSSGEKQLLLILIKVFLQEKQPAIMLMDEPEQSLHICWQQHLIEAIRLINPNCQLIITTHSPSILSQGWSDKIVYMEKIVK